LADQGRIVKMWFQKSSEDLRATKLLLSQTTDEFLGPAIFHAQQSAEKAIKGFLSFYKVRFPKTHDLGILAQLVGTTDADLGKALEPCAILTKFAVAYRYPEEAESPEPLTRATVDKALVLANWVFEELRAKSLEKES